jgi:hypothetical protein
MPNGKPGDNHYDDIVKHGFDSGSRQIAELVRALHRIGDDDVQHLVADLLEFLVPNGRSRFPDFQRQQLLKHLRTIERLATGSVG